MTELTISGTRREPVGGARRRPAWRSSAIAAAAVVVLAGCSGPPPIDGAAAAPHVQTPSASGPGPGPGEAPAREPTATVIPSETASVEPTPTPAIAVDPVQAPWTRALDQLVSGPHVSVAVGVGERIVYAYGGSIRRVPASGQKLLTSIAALDRFGPAHRLPTIVAARERPRDGVVRGDLWLVGGGDPELGAPRLGTLADALAAAGVRRVTGSVAGDTEAFSRRWWAPGWVQGLSRHYVTRPTALVFDGNVAATPELAAARGLEDALEDRGIVVDGGARSGDAPERVRQLAQVGSAPLRDLLARQNHASSNLHAEVLLRALGADDGDPTTAGGADVVEEVVADTGYAVRVRDGSGLSHGNAVSAVDLTSLLLVAASEPWAPAFEASLPAPGQGTLRGRLLGVPVRAKTGTLFTVPCSTLAGYVRDANGRRVAFAVLSDGIPKGSSIAVEDAVVRLLASSAVA